MKPNQLHEKERYEDLLNWLGGNGKPYEYSKVREAIAILDSLYSRPMPVIVNQALDQALIGLFAAKSLLEPAQLVETPVCTAADEKYVAQIESMRKALRDIASIPRYSVIDDLGSFFYWVTGRAQDELKKHEQSNDSASNSPSSRS